MSRGNLNHSGLRWAMGGHGFTFRLSHDLAFNSDGQIVNQSPPPRYNTISFDSDFVGLEWIQLSDPPPEIETPYRHTSAFLLNGSLGKYVTIKEHDKLCSGNQFCFVWSYNENTGAWEAGPDVFSWYHSSAGDGPVGKLFTGNIGELHPLSPTNIPQYIGSSRYHVGGSTNTYDSDTGIVTYNTISSIELMNISHSYSGTEHGDHIQGVSTPSYDETGNLGYSIEAMSSIIYRNGNVFINSNYRTLNEGMIPGQSALSRYIDLEYGQYDITTVMYSCILGCHAINKDRLFVIIGIKFNPLGSGAENTFRVFFFDVNKKNDTVKFGNNDDKDFLIEEDLLLKVQIGVDVFGQPIYKTFSNEDVFIYPWRFSQDGTKLSCLTVHNEIYTYISSGTTIHSTKKGIRLRTYSISYDEETDSYSLAESSNTNYLPYMKDAWTETNTESEVDHGSYSTFEAHNYYSNLLTIEGDTSWPVAINYKNNELKICWFNAYTGTLWSGEDSSEAYSSNGLGEDDYNYGSGSQYYSGTYFSNPSRLIPGSLVMANGASINLVAESMIETHEVLSSYANDNAHGHFNLTTGSDRAANQYSVFYINAAENIIIYGRRSTQLNAESSYTKSITHISGTEFEYSWSVDNLGGTQLFIYNNGITETLVNSVQSRTISASDTVAVEVPGMYSVTLHTGSGLVGSFTGNNIFAINPYSTVFNEGAINLGLLSYASSFDDYTLRLLSHNEKSNINVGVTVDLRRKEKNMAYWFDCRQINCNQLSQSSNEYRFDYWRGYSESLFDRISLCEIIAEKDAWQTVINEFLIQINEDYSTVTLYPIGLY